MWMAARRWFPAVYGAGFMAVLAYLTFAASFINRELWAELWSYRTAGQRLMGTDPLRAFGVVAAVVALALLLKRVDPKFKPQELVAANVNFRPLFWRFWRWPFALLLLWNLPVLAMAEEFIFRHGFGQWPLLDWHGVLLRSIAFGLFHALVTWNLRGGIVQAVLAFWFSAEYLDGGWDRASMAHFLVDLFAFAPALAQLLHGQPRLKSV